MKKWPEHYAPACAVFIFAVDTHAATLYNCNVGITVIVKYVFSFLTWRLMVK